MEIENTGNFEINEKDKIPLCNLITRMNYEDEDLSTLIFMQS